MRLIGRRLLMIVIDGVEEEEVNQLKGGFEEENAEVFLVTPQEFCTVETVSRGKRGKDIATDIPFDGLNQLEFDGLVIPGGAISTQLLRKSEGVLLLIKDFHSKSLPIFASGDASEILYDCDVLSHQVVVREGSPFAQFLDQATEALLSYPAQLPLYRPLQHNT